MCRESMVLVGLDPESLASKTSVIIYYLQNLVQCMIMHSTEDSRNFICCNVMLYFCGNAILKESFNVEFIIFLNLQSSGCTEQG